MSGLFEPVEAPEISSRGRYSRKIIESFLAEVQTAGQAMKLKKDKYPDVTATYMSLRSYLAHHPSIPVRVVMSNSEICLIRL